MLLSLFSLALASPIFKREDNCQVLSTLFLQCSNGPSSAPSIYTAHCELSADGSTKCCAVNKDQSVSDNCHTTSAWTGEGARCETDSTTLQTVCRGEDGGFSSLSPICYGSSDGSHKCCSRSKDGSVTDNCVE